MTFATPSAYGRSNVRGSAVPHKAAGKIGRELMSAKRVPLRIRVVAAALAVAALVGGGLASTETAASAGRGIVAGRGI
jgi:hypothetical protein